MLLLVAGHAGHFAVEGQLVMPPISQDGRCWLAEVAKAVASNVENYAACRRVISANAAWPASVNEYGA
jgi:hypothetical protein